jgi:AcrR family transcriptional regulator
MPKLSDAAMEMRRKDILAAAGRCFARAGIEATTMRDIFAEVGMSAGAVYNYFASKDDLIAAIVEDSLAQSRAVMETFDEGGLTIERYGRLIDVVLDDLDAAAADGRARLSLMIAAHAAVSPRLSRSVLNGRAAVRAMATAQIARIRPDLDAAGCAALVAFVFTLYEGLVHAAALGEPLDLPAARARMKAAIASRT